MAQQLPDRRLILIGLALLAGCVLPPKVPMRDRPVKIHIYNWIADDQGSVDPREVTDDATVTGTSGTTVWLLAAATGSGGVASFSLTVNTGSRVIADVQVSAAPAKRVEPSLRILGSDGAGAAGAQPIALALVPGAHFDVRADARNFFGSQTSIRVDYQVGANCLPGQVLNLAGACVCPLLGGGDPSRETCGGTRCCADNEICCFGRCQVSRDCSGQCASGKEPCGGGCCDAGWYCKAGTGRCYPLGF